MSPAASTTSEWLPGNRAISPSPATTTSARSRFVKGWPPTRPISRQASGNLGIVAANQGDLVLARDLFQRSLAIHERLAPDSLDVAGSLNNLGAVADSQGDLAAARDYHERAFAIRKRLAPGSLAVAASLNNLGEVARHRGDLAAARDYHER